MTVKIENIIIDIFLLNMELPEDVLKIIREFSRPLTRPDWRTLHIMPQYEYIKILKEHTLVNTVVTPRNYYIKIKNIRFWLYGNS
jgi:hypothetical protein